MKVSFDWLALMYCLVTYFPVMFIHEMGHYIVGRMQGAPGGEIHFGPRNRKSYCLRIGRLDLIVHPSLLIWFHPPMCYTRHRKRFGGGHDLLLAAGGPLASLIFLVCVHQMVVKFVPLYWSALTTGHLAILVDSWGRAFVWWGILAFVMPLVPWKYRDDLDSDGLAILRSLKLILNRRRRAGAMEGNTADHHPGSGLP